MAMAASPNSFILQKPNRLSQTHLLLKNTTSHFNGVLNLTTPRKPISITCSAAPSPVQDLPPTSTTQSQDRLFNFDAGPATLPESVLKKAESELYNWRVSGMSIMEMSHRGKEFLYIIQKTKLDLHALLDIPSDYIVLFLQGEATTQFAAIPLNLYKPDDPLISLLLDHGVTRISKEAQKYCKPNLIWSGKSEKYTKIPSFDGSDQNLHAKYLHICANETIHGVEFKNYPTQKNPNGILIADMSLNFCSKLVDVSKFGVIYAGAQKNVGPYGVTIVIIKKDLIGHAQDMTPVMLDYKIHVDTERERVEINGYWRWGEVRHGDCHHKKLVV